MEEPNWVLERSVLEMHSRLVERSGEIPGLISEHLLLSTLDRPQNLFYYGDEVNLFDLAASYGYGFAKNHCFYSANKRICFVVVCTFLRINNYKLAASKDDTLDQISGLAKGEVSQEDFAKWLFLNSKLISDI